MNWKMLQERSAVQAREDTLHYAIIPNMDIDGYHLSKNLVLTRMQPPGTMSNAGLKPTAEKGYDIWHRSLVKSRYAHRPMWDRLWFKQNSSHNSNATMQLECLYYIERISTHIFTRESYLDEKIYQRCWWCNNGKGSPLEITKPLSKTQRRGA